jgi:hypothetical protein
VNRGSTDLASYMLGIYDKAMRERLSSLRNR